MDDKLSLDRSRQPLRVSALTDAADELRRRGLDVAVDERRNFLIAKDPAKNHRPQSARPAPPKPAPGRLGFEGVGD